MRTLRPPNDESSILNMIGFSSDGASPGSERSPFGNGTNLINAMTHSGSSGGPPWSSSSRNSGI